MAGKADARPTDPTPADRPAGVRLFGDRRRTEILVLGVMVLLLWFYVSGIAMLIGAELNSEIEHASPYGKDPGERVPGEKKVIGPRAERLYEEKRASGEIPIKPMPEGLNCDVDRAATVEPPKPKASDLLIGTIAMLPAAIAAGKKIRDELKRDALKKSA